MPNSEPLNAHRDRLPAVAERALKLMGALPAIPRYTVRTDGQLNYAGMAKCGEGEWVKYSDLERLIRESGR
jgi:hypothetical protein